MVRKGGDGIPEGVKSREGCGGREPFGDEGRPRRAVRSAAEHRNDSVAQSKPGPRGVCGGSVSRRKLHGGHAQDNQKKPGNDRKFLYQHLIL